MVGVRDESAFLEKRPQPLEFGINGFGPGSGTRVPNSFDIR